MNITFPRSRIGSWLPLLLALAMASAVGLGVGIGTVMLINGKWQSEYDRLNAPSTGAIASNVGPSLVLYLVDSQDQEEWVLGSEQVAAEDRASSNTVDAEYSFRILRMTTPQDELSVADIAQAWSEQPEGLQIVDMRRK